MTRIGPSPSFATGTASRRRSPLHRKGRRYAGEGLIDKAHEERLQDSYIYAMRYVYRHALELALKHGNYITEAALAARGRMGFVKEADRLTRNQVDDETKAMPYHRLVPLLNRLEGRLELIESAEPFDPEVKAVMVAVEMSDHGGQKFRFPSLTKGRGASFKPPKKGQSNIDLEGIRDTIGPAIGNLIDPLDSWMFADIEAMQAVGDDIGM